MNLQLKYFLLSVQQNILQVIHCWHSFTFVISKKKGCLVYRSWCRQDRTM